MEEKEKSDKVNEDACNRSWVEDGLVRTPEGLSEEQREINVDKIKIVIEMFMKELLKF